MRLEGVEKSKLESLKFQPGAVLGAGRYPLNTERLTIMRRNLQQRDISQLVLVGGNGTMWAADQIVTVCPDVQVLGIPKTVDNDLWGTDHSPGYLSAAKFIGEAVGAIALDLWAMRNFERVRIVEVMGRNVGWLAAAASLAQLALPNYPPIQLYVPEHPFSLEEFFARVDEHLRMHPCLLAVVSEGARDESGKPISEYAIGGNKSSTIPGGVAPLLSLKLRERGVPSRAENLGILQRSNIWSVCERDRREAILLGKEAIKALGEGKSQVMLGLTDQVVGLNEVKVEPVAFKDIAGLERPLDPSFLNGWGLNPSFAGWLQARMGEPLAETESTLDVWLLANKRGGEV